MPTQIVTYGVEKLTLPQGTYYRPFVVKKEENAWRAEYTILFVQRDSTLTRSFALGRTAIKTKAKAEGRLTAALRACPDKPSRTRMRYRVGQIVGRAFATHGISFAPLVTHAAEPRVPTIVYPNSPAEGHRTWRYGCYKYTNSVREAVAWIRKTSPDANVDVIQVVA
jgi:hypothetical protein